MTDLRTEPVARRTRSSGRHVAANPDSSIDNSLDAAVNTPLPEVQPSSRTRGLGPDTITDLGSLQDYRPLGQKASNSERKAAVKDAAHSASMAVQEAVQQLPDRYGPAVPQSQREAAGKALLVVALLWLLSILVGGWLHQESYHAMDPKALQRRLPLLWFDRLLRRFGPFLPLPVVALRLASDLVMLRGEQHRLAGLQSGRLQGHYTETAVVYLGVSVMRVLVYFLHCAGIYLLLSRIGVVSAVPVQLMSDHIFLGASVVAILSAELVLLRVNLRSQREPLAAQLLGIAGLVLAAALVALSCGDMHYTARFFHERTETTLGALLGLLAFQIPVAWWLLYGFTVPMGRV